MLLKVGQMLASTVIGGVLSAAGWTSAGRDPIDWTSVSIDSIEGGKLSTADLEGKAVLLVNTASFCGFTRQYKGLEALYRRYKDKGLVVLGVPSNDFGAQEPGTSAEIRKFCEATFDVTFPLADKQVVSGKMAH